MKKGELKKWERGWEYVDKIFLWGGGRNCRSHLAEISEEIEIEGIIDRDSLKEGTTIEGIPVILPYIDTLTNKKIVITTHYGEVSRDLKNAGMEEYIDFCDLRLFLTARAWYRRRQVVLSEVHIAVTTRCTLNCKHCNMYIPFHKGHEMSISIADLKDQLRLLFSHVDRIINLVLIGGEPLLYEDLHLAVEYIGSYYSDRVRNIEIVTNGTVVPQTELLEVLHKYDVLVSMSDYHLNSAYSKRFHEIERLFLRSNIRVNINQELQWKDFSFPYTRLCLPDDIAYKNMELCDPSFRGYNDSKLYFCHLVWSADRAGIFQEKNTDYIDLASLSADDHEKVVMLNVCCHDEGYVSLCKDCGGCSSMNQKLIPAGRQTVDGGSV